MSSQLRIPDQLTRPGRGWATSAGWERGAAPVADRPLERLLDLRRRHLDRDLHAALAVEAIGRGALAVARLERERDAVLRERDRHVDRLGVEARELALGVVELALDRGSRIADDAHVARAEREPVLAAEHDHAPQPRARDRTDQE